MDKKQFFDAVRPMFRRGRLTVKQVEGMEAVIDYGQKMLRSHLAYVLATDFHETGEKMQPVREGFAKTNLAAVRAVTALYNKGIISVNYAVPNSKGLSYYGRGLVQITWRDNYFNMGKLIGVDLVSNPDLALEMNTALDCLFMGMNRGMYRRGYSLAMIPESPTFDDFVDARNIINGDVGKNGRRVAEVAVVFYNALLIVKPVRRDEKEHTLWCRLLDILGLGDHSDTGR